MWGLLNRATLLRTLSFLAVTAIASCYHPQPSPTMVPVYRFADREWRAKAETNMVVATDTVVSAFQTTDYPYLGLDDETRYTLGTAVRAPLLLAFNQAVGADAFLQLTLTTPPQLQPGSRVVVQAVSTVDAVRKHYPPVFTDVTTHDGTPRVSFSLALPTEYANRNIGLYVEATTIPTQALLYHRTPAVVVPPDAYMDFALGVEEPARDQGSVEFRLAACSAEACSVIFKEIFEPDIAEEQAWQNRRIDLKELAGQEISFLFESEPLSQEVAAFSLPAWANPTIYAPASEPDSRPNVILISLDTLSANHLPTYGYELPTAPFVDKVLARNGLVFEHAVAASTTTPQSHMSMFTSVQPCRHGVLTGMEAVHENLATLAEVLRSVGYETGAVTEDGWLGYQNGFGRGFNVYSENKSADVMTPEGQLDLTLTKARSWIRRNAYKRFFLFLHTFQVHDPYSPPDSYKNLFRERGGIVVGEASPRPLRDAVAYDQEIRYVDHLMEAFFEFLRERGLLENTVIILTSDHGEEFFQHGNWGHGRNLYEEVTRVPLIFWGPAWIPRGERDGRTVGHIDLMPTILGLAGSPVPAQTSGRNILLPALPAVQSMPDARFTESRVTVAITEGYEKVAVLSPSFMVQQENRKLARYREATGHRYEAYDLDVDPGEKADRLLVEEGGYESMRRMLDGYEAACIEAAPPAGEARQPAQVDFDLERQQKLRALGYLE